MSADQAHHYHETVFLTNYCHLSPSEVSTLDGMEAACEPDPTLLPWGAWRERIEFPEAVHINTNAKAGQFILHTLFAEFTVLAEKKIEQVLDAAVSNNGHRKLICPQAQASICLLSPQLFVIRQGCRN